MKSYRELEEKFYTEFIDVGECSQCGEQCSVIEIDCSFDYAPAHATHGLPGTHHESYWGSDCCHAVVEI